MSAPPSVCFVNSDFPPIVHNGGIGTHYRLLSEALAAEGWRVHVLFCGLGDDPEARRDAPESLAERSIGFTALEDLPTPESLAAPNHGGDPHWTEMSQRLVDALEALDAEHRFDLVEFQDWGGLGFRPVQAKRLGAALREVPMAVKLLSSTRWQRQGNLSWPSAPGDLQLEFLERYAFEHADVQLSPSRHMIEQVRGTDWAVRDEIDVAYVFPEPVTELSGEAGPLEELVFFGRLERRKGLDLFLDALSDLPPEIPAVFLGRDTEIDGRAASELIRDRLGGRPHRIELDVFGEGALRFLASGRRLAVIPSYMETFGFTVAECVANRIPFVASRVGAIPEVLRDSEAQRRWLFDPNAADLTAAIRRRLAASEAEESALRSAAQEQASPARWNPGLLETYERCARPRRADRPRRSTGRRVTVSVAVAHHDHGAYLPAALASLAAQTRVPDEVIVIDDGSTDEASLRVFAEQEARYPDWRFLRQENAGPGAARNACLAEAGGDYFLPFDSDNIARPSLVESLATAVESQPTLDAVSCHLLAFETDEDRNAGRFAFRYSPAGGPLLYSVLGNVYGDSCALFRAEALRSVEGFETDRSSPEEDWETFIKMAVRGLQLDVVPEVLLEYRHRPDGRTGLLRAPMQAFSRRRRILETFFADAPLTREQRMDLWECLLGFNHLANVRGHRAAVRFAVLQEALDRAQERARELEAAAALPAPARHQVADRIHALLGRVPGLLDLLRALRRRLG